MPNQYFATNRMVGDGSTTSWPFSFSGARSDNGDGTAPYLTQDDVQVALVVYDPEGRESWEPISFELVGPSTVEVVPAIELDQEFVVYRSTEIDVPVADFTDFSSISERDLDDSFRQTLFVTQEALDRVQDAVNAANSVQGTAGEALNTSNEALATAQASVLIANEAENKADQAVGTANAAENKADQAVGTANAAAADAAEALGTANTALSTTETFSERVDDLQDSVDELLDGGTVGGLMFKDENLAGLTDYNQARQNLGLGTASTRADTRYAHRANNLSDLGNAATARNNLGLGTAATANSGTGASQVPTTSQADARYLRPSTPAVIDVPWRFNQGIEVPSLQGVTTIGGAYFDVNSDTSQVTLRVGRRTTGVVRLLLHTGQGTANTFLYASSDEGVRVGSVPAPGAGNLSAEQLFEGSVRVANQNRTVSSGAGLIGGGDLSENRTISLGTPSSITATSTNSSSGNTHTHTLGSGTIRTLYAESAFGALGTYIISGGPSTGVGSTRLGSDLAASVAGTWRHHGGNLWFRVA